MCFRILLRPRAKRSRHRQSCLYRARSRWPRHHSGTAHQKFGASLAMVFALPPLSSQPCIRSCHCRGRIRVSRAEMEDGSTGPPEFPHPPFRGRARLPRSRRLPVANSVPGAVLFKFATGLARPVEPERLAKYPDHDRAVTNHALAGMEKRILTAGNDFGEGRQHSGDGVEAALFIRIHCLRSLFTRERRAYNPPGLNAAHECLSENIRTNPAHRMACVVSRWPHGRRVSQRGLEPCSSVGASGLSPGFHFSYSGILRTRDDSSHLQVGETVPSIARGSTVLTHNQPEGSSLAFNNAWLARCPRDGGICCVASAVHRAHIQVLDCVPHFSGNGETVARGSRDVRQSG